ncbi:MAG: His/Gly/Thr/Pro-type tRNA ligase C-terminal domain-containing protein [Sandaracinaceae bacterium]|nr:His/Gly/Thr/Pro-type tRNA ligase C-terminal domain-containing protein [Sandaracinaceae bacterium]
MRTLDALGTPYRTEPTLVRGLDYYSRTLFEVQGRGGELGAQNTLCGGGRYDGLVEVLGGPATPAIGFAMGLERLLLVMASGPSAPRTDAFVVVTDRELRRDAARLLKDLRAGGLSADADLRGGSVKSQLRRADKAGAAVALVLGPSEVERSVVQLKDLRAGTQTEVSRADAVAQAARVAGRERA